ncbi:MAG: metallophosphoesterase family protein [Pirellulales bacterium]
MPGVFSSPISRKQFLKTGALAAGAMLLRPQATQAESDKASTHLAILSDTHLPADAKNEYRGFRPMENLETVLPQVIQAEPEGVIINGDAARLTGEIDDYKTLHGMLTPLAEKAPIYIGLGNHDHRGNFAKVFANQADANAKVSNKHVLVIDYPAVRVVVLDSLLYVNKVAGLLGKSQRDWLTKFLETAEKRPTVFFVHHTLNDSDSGLLDADRMFAIMEPHKHVKAVFYGHSHRWEFSKRGHIHLINLPAVGYNFNDEQPVGWVDATFTEAGAELTLQAFGGNQKDHGKKHQLSWS